MATFDPINEAHSVVEAVLLFQFSSSLDAIMANFDGLVSEWKDEFPRVERTQGFAIHIDAVSGGQSVNTLAAGYEFKRFKTDGNLEWLVRISADSITIHCLEYTRWASVWQKMQSLAHSILARLSGTPAIPTTVGIKYIDRYVFSGNIREYDASLLFEKSSPYMNQMIFSSDARWHVHTGNFLKISGIEHEVLNQLNIDSALNFLGGEQNCFVTIDNNLVVRAQAPHQLAAYVAGKRDPKPLAVLAENLHRENKLILARLLTKQMQTRINLHVGGVP